MHEVLSIVFLCLEIDLLTNKLEEGREKDDDSPYQLIGKSNHDITHRLFDSSKIANDAFVIFEAIMALLSPAFEVRDLHNNTSSSTSPMEVIGIDTVDKIRILARDEELYQFITSVTIPPELYCTRWIRLMFSREVKGLDNVLKLWDAFFQLTSSLSSSSEITDVHGGSSGEDHANPMKNNLMNILETTAASMIMMIRNELIPPPTLPKHQLQFVGVQGGEEDDRDPNECIHLLMNYPVIEDVSKLITLTEEMIYGRFNLTSHSASPQIVMNDEMNFNMQNQDIRFNDNNSSQNHQMNTNNLPQNMLPPHSSTMNNNMNMYGFSPQNGQEVDPMAYASNQNQHGAPYFNQPNQGMLYPPKGQMYIPNQMNQNTYPMQQEYNDPIRSTIENIAGKETWKKLSGGISEGLNVFKGALGSLDHTIQNLTVSNDSNLYSPYKPSSQQSQQQPNNVYNPGHRDINNHYDPGSMTSNKISNEQHLIIDGQVIKNRGNFIGEESVYSPGYRDVSNISHQDFGTNAIQNNQKKTIEAMASVDDPLSVETQLQDDQKVIVSMEDQFIGGGAKAKDVHANESHRLVERLDSSLLKLSAYIQTQMMHTGGSNPIPQSVWDAMAEIEAVKSDLLTLHDVSRKGA